MSGSKIAYKSDSVKLEKAQWDTTYGMWVTFELPQSDAAIKQAHPFKKFTKRRKDRTGTRFAAVFYTMDEISAYQDDVMLKGWSDGTSGWKVSFYVNADDEGFHPFMSFDKGHEFALAMVELDDDNEAINQTKVERLEAAKEGRKSPRLSNYAAQLCRTPEFIRYIGDRCGEQPSSPEHSEQFAAEWLRKTLKIASRRELDTDGEAATCFHKRIREPYNMWYRARHE